MTSRQEFWLGVRTVLPIVIGVIPFGLVTGVSAITAGMSTGEALNMSWIVFAGASQIAANELWARGAPAILVVITAVVINARFMMYSAAIAPYLKNVSWLRKILLAYILTDQAFGITIAHFNEHPERQHKPWYYFGAALPFWIVWQISGVVGIFLGQTLPAEWQLDFAVPLSFIAILIPAIKDRPSVIAAIVGGLTATLLAPTRVGVLVGAFLGIAAGYMMESKAKS
ncbi:MAG: AzlC family ABC transporter permease [Anaerolineae bacterium]|nr:AzlC family ABC transporter permease [Anaerolineae bacterium]MCA9908217.1 AzlC family ABC transporter permease [Anaerolineae bacterium]